MYRGSAALTSPPPGVVAADVEGSSSADSSGDHHHYHCGAGGSHDNDHYPAEADPPLLLPGNASASSASDATMMAASYGQAQERAERRRRRAALKQKRSSSGVGAGTRSMSSSAHHTSSSSGGLPINRYRRSRNGRRGGLKGGGGRLGVNSDAVVRLMLIGFFLFLLCTMAMYRLLSSDRRVTAAGIHHGDLTDELPSEPHLGGGGGGEGNLRSGGGAGGGGGGDDGNPYLAAQRQRKRKNRGGLMNRVNSATSWLANLPFAGSAGTYPKPSPESMGAVGDKTKRYYELRKEIDEILPIDPDRTRRRVRNELRRNTYESMRPEELPYDVNNCPLYPPDGYPYAWSAMDLVENWPPDDPTPRSKIYNGICVFDYETELEKAKIYRAAEVPFVVRDDPQVLRTAERWNHPGYMLNMLSDTPHRTEYSPNNHFMYWMAENPNKKRKKFAQQLGRGGRPKWPTPPEGWKPPTKLLRMPYEEWVGHANTTDDKLGPDMPHWYYRLIGCGAQGRCDKDSSEYLFDEMPFFQPRDGGLYIVEPQRQKGIHCRFGMKGVIAENHFDGSRNSIAVLGGERRYILAHPEQCPNLALYPKEHPSARHSAVDWSDPDLDTYPEFVDARANEVILQAGDVLYLPTNWFHFIVSLTMNFQCNTRSGISSHYMQPMKDCGFF